MHPSRVPFRGLLFLGVLLASASPAETQTRHKMGTGKSSPPPVIELTPKAGASTRPGVGRKTSPEEHSELDGTEVSGSAATAPCTQKHPVETFLQISSASRPQSARDGGVFFLSDLRESPQVFYLKTNSTWPEQLSFFPDGVPYFSVSPDGKRLLIASQVGGDEQYDIYLLEVGKKELVPLIVDRNKRIESVAWGPTSDWFVYTSNERNKVDMDLYRYDLAAKKAVMLTQLAGHNEVTDVAPDGNLIAMTQVRSISDMDILVFNQKTGVLDSPTRDSEENAFHDAEFTSNSGSLLLLSDAGGQFTQLYLLDLKTPKARKPVTSGKWDVDFFTLDHARTELLYAFNEDGYTRLEAFTLDAKGKKSRLLSVPKLERGVITAASFAPADGRNGFFFSLTSSTQSGDIWHWAGQKKTRWTQSTHGFIDPMCFAKEKLIHYPSFDGTMIPAYLYLPNDYNPSAKLPIPFVVYVHGGPESQMRPVFSKTFQYFLQRGFGILATNIRGSTGYGKDYCAMDNYKKRMDSVKDVVEGAQWLLKQRYSKAGQLALYGGSYGGFLVLRTIEVAPELFSAASSSVGIANFVTFLQNTKPYRRALREVEYGPLSDTEFLKSISPMTYIDKIQTPLLLFHGANDPRVPVSESEQIIAELKRRSVPVDYKIFPDEGHGNAKLRNILEQGRQMVFFFEKYLMKKTP